MRVGDDDRRRPGCGDGGAMTGSSRRSGRGSGHADSRAGRGTARGPPSPPVQRAGQATRRTAATIPERRLRRDDDGRRSPRGRRVRAQTSARTSRTRRRSTTAAGTQTQKPNYPDQGPFSGAWTRCTAIEVSFLMLKAGSARYRTPMTAPETVKWSYFDRKLRFKLVRVADPDSKVLYTAHPVGEDPLMAARLERRRSVFGAAVGPACAPRAAARRARTSPGASVQASRPRCGSRCPIWGTRWDRCFADRTWRQRSEGCAQDPGRPDGLLGDLRRRRTS